MQSVKVWPRQINQCTSTLTSLFTLYAANFKKSIHVMPHAVVPCSIRLYGHVHSYNHDSRILVTMLRFNYDNLIYFCMPTYHGVKANTSPATATQLRFFHLWYLKHVRTVCRGGIISLEKLRMAEISTG